MEYTVKGTIYDSNSSINDRIKDALLRRDVYACVTDLMTSLLRNEETRGEWGDDFVNLTFEACPECGGRVQRATDLDRNDIVEQCGGNYEDVDLNEFRVCQICGRVISQQNVDIGSNNPMEYWIVNSELGHDLMQRGEVVMERPLGWIWGRCAHGQQILCDDVINRIAYDMGILQGLQYSWENHV